MTRLVRNPRSKYGNRRPQQDGITFGSAAELRRYQNLLLLARAGEIRDLQVHRRFALRAGGLGSQIVGYYEADFDYLNRNHRLVIEDVKGVRTALYRWKRKHFEAQYGVTITEIEVAEV